MARGNLFEISTFIEDLGETNETDFYVQCGIIADFFSDIDPVKPTKELLFRFVSAGIETGVQDDADGASRPWFRLTERSRQEYFRPRYEDFKRVVSELTLEEFSTSTATITNLIETQYGDAVYVPDNAGTYFDSIDEFLRNASLDVKYYIGNVIFMN